ncbi:restriction endonuclease subunit S [Micrococcus luteus]|uniref:restriction endonuclease subunit S n=1 Tax=Micrococcus luteus TaxID=1270 RepID=UPI00352C7D0A
MTFERVRLGSLAEVTVSNVDKHSVDGQPIVRLCNYTDVYYQHALDQSREYMVATASPGQIQNFRLQVDDVVITKDSETADDIGIPALITETADDFVCGYHLAILRPNPQKTDGRYLNWVLQSDDLKAQFENIAFGVTRVGLKTGRIKTLEIPVPGGQSAQARVADYLDRETATIDALIEKQMSLIAGLIERRRATISKSVVTGLHGSAVRCTGDTYFPRIADTWQLQPLGYGYDVVLGKMLDAKRAAQDGDTELPYVRAANIKDGYLDLEDINFMAYTPYEVMRLDLRAGDLLVVEGGSVGQSALLKEPMPGWSFQKTVNRVRSRKQWSTAYLHYVLSHMRGRGHFDLICSGSTIAHLTAEKLRAIKIPVPPPAEQREIADHLDRETAKIDALIAKAERFIELAQERRAALITAAVTGQIEIPTED